MIEGEPLCNWVDMAVAGTMLVCLILGAMSGLVMQIVGLLSLAAGVGVSAYAGPMAGGALERWIENPSAARFCGYIVVFLATCFVIRLGAKVLKALIDTAGLRGVDRMGGALLGFFKGWLFASILIVIAAQHGSEKIRATLETSLSGSILLHASDAAVAWARERNVPDTLDKATKSAVDKAKTWRDTTQGSIPNSTTASPVGVADQMLDPGELPEQEP